MRKVAILILLAGCVILAGAPREGGGRQIMSEFPRKLARPRPSRGIGRMRSGHVQRCAARPVTFARTSRSGYSDHACRSTCRGGGWNARSGLGLRTRHVDDQAGDVVSVVDQGGEPHTFTEVKAFGNGFLPPLNPGSATSVIPECAGGFENIAVARTRILQGSHLDITGLSKGKHLFQCCIHPWMRMEVDVK